MNNISITGTLVDDAEQVLIATAHGEMPLVVFSLLDTGLPYARGDPLIIEVHCQKDFAVHNLSYLKKNKEVTVYGYLRQKKRMTGGDELRLKYYISAESFKFHGQPAGVKK